MTYRTSYNTSGSRPIWNFYLKALLPFDLAKVRAERTGFKNAHKSSDTFGWEDVVLHFVDKNKTELYAITAIALTSLVGSASTQDPVSLLFLGIAVLASGLTASRILSIFQQNIHHCLDQNADIYRAQFMYTNRDCPPALRQTTNGRN